MMRNEYSMNADLLYGMDNLRLVTAWIEFVSSRISSTVSSSHLVLSPSLSFRTFCWLACLLLLLFLHTCVRSVSKARLCCQNKASLILSSGRQMCCYSKAFGKALEIIQKIDFKIDFVFLHGFIYYFTLVFCIKSVRQRGYKSEALGENSDMAGIKKAGILQGSQHSGANINIPSLVYFNYIQV